MHLTSGLKVVADGLGFPEGPVVARDGTLYFVDIAYQKLMKLVPGGKAETVVDIPGGPNGMAIGRDGRAYICNNGGIFDFQRFYPDKTKTGSDDRNDYLLFPKPGCPGANYGGKPAKAGEGPASQTATAWQPGDPIPDPAAGSIWQVDLQTREAKELFGPSTGDRLIAPDDIVFDPHGPEGSFWFTDCGYQNDHILRKGGVYAANINGMHPVKMADIPSANGIGFTKDGKSLYVSDTLYGRLWLLPIEDDPVLVDQPKGKKPYWTRTVPQDQLSLFPGEAVLALPGPQWLDSLKLQADGKVCIGTLLNGGITVFDPVTRAVDFLRVGPTLPDGSVASDPFTSNLCFGGDKMLDVWITASSSGKIYHGRWPSPGLPPAFHI